MLTCWNQIVLIKLIFLSVVLSCAPFASDSAYDIHLPKKYETIGENNEEIWNWILISMKEWEKTVICTPKFSYSWNGSPSNSRMKKILREILTCFLLHLLYLQTIMSNWGHAKYQWTNCLFHTLHCFQLQPHNSYIPTTKINKMKPTHTKSPQ